MPFASINSIDPRTNLWNFGENCSAFGSGWKTQFLWVGHFDFFSCFIHIQINLIWYLLCVPPIANPGGPSKTPPMVQAVPATTPPFTDSWTVTLRPDSSLNLESMLRISSVLMTILCFGGARYIWNKNKKINETKIYLIDRKKISRNFSPLNKIVVLLIYFYKQKYNNIFWTLNHFQRCS